jgi:hypothetical protein
VKLDVWKDAMPSGYPKAAIDVANMRNVNPSCSKNKKRGEKKLSPQQNFLKIICSCLSSSLHQRCHRKNDT